MTIKILLVEDEDSIAEPLSFLLEREGFQVMRSADGVTALTDFHDWRPDLVLLDLMLPGKSGTEICREIRSSSRTPIIMLTAKDSEIDIVVGLELGADDYITKPYSTRELLARINAVLRRTPADADILEDSDVLELSGIALDTARHSLTVRGEEVQIPLREFEVLEFLMRNAGRVMTRGQLLDRVWGSDYFGDTKTLDVHIKRIRSRIEEKPSHPTLLTTVRGVGYRFEG